jgi:hypothetical protein
MAAIACCGLVYGVGYIKNSAGMGVRLALLGRAARVPPNRGRSRAAEAWGIEHGAARAIPGRMAAEQAAAHRGVATRHAGR